MGSLMKLALFVVIHALIIVEGARISPKLDFGESELVQVKKEIKTGKIKGVKVTVDTSELKESRSSSGSESSSSSESSEKKKTVGVRTDVTFEITSGETNDTKTVDEKEIGKDDDNASIPVVPVFKGKPDRGEGGNKGGSNWSVKPLDHPSATGGLGYNYNRQPNRNSQEDRNQYASDESWRQVPQYAIWTTERYNDQPVYIRRDQYGDVYPHPPSNFIPYHIHHDHDHHHPQPCACKPYPGPFIDSRPSSTENQRNQRVHDKLDRPFSNTS